MRKLMTAALAALTLAGGLTAATTADAQSRYRRNDSSAAVAAGIAGLALGAALGSRGSTSFSYGYPSYGYGYGYGSGYGYAQPYYGGGYYDRRYYAPPPRYVQPRVCTYWRYDRWGRAYPVTGRC